MTRKNRFDRFVESEKKSKTAEAKLSRQKKEYLLNLSKDSAGNSPEDFLDKSDSNACREFLRTMAANKYTGADRLKLEILKRKKILSQVDMLVGSWSSSKARRLRASLRWLVLWRGYGYKIGILSNENYPGLDNAEVYLCTDGLLRCRRYGSIFYDGTSYASGIGRLPTDFKLLGKFKLSTGRFVVQTSKDTAPIFKYMSPQEIFEEIIKNNLV